MTLDEYIAKLQNLRGEAEGNGQLNIHGYYFDEKTGAPNHGYFEPQPYISRGYMSGRSYVIRRIVVMA